jgi:hypothetical protein
MRVLHSSTAGIYREFRNVSMDGLSRTIINGGLVLASIGLLFR